MTTLELLLEARRKIEDPLKWASDINALGPGKNCASTAMGSGLESGVFEAHRRFALANDLGNDSSYTSVMRFNDTHTHAEVLAAFDRAIAAEYTGEI